MTQSSLSVKLDRWTSNLLIFSNFYLFIVDNEIIGIAVSNLAGA